MDSLVNVLLSIILTVASHPYGEPPSSEQVERQRLAGIATDIATVSSQSLYGGPKGPEATALTLLTVAQHESGFWSNVQDCSLCYPGSEWCDRGRSVTIYQLQGRFAWGTYTRAELCEDNGKATERAHAVLFKFRNNHSPLAMFDSYARGGSLRIAPCKAAREMNNMLQLHLRKRGITITYRKGSMWADTAKGGRQ